MLKRSLDFILALLGLVLLSPLCGLIALWIKQDSPGPVLYRSERVGLKGVHFEIIKFRTMVVDADQTGPSITTGQDARITPIGKWLRHYRLDEIPQLWNVLLGEMSLVGPRPEAPAYVHLYSPEQRRVLTVKPGLAGITQLNYKDEATLLTGPNWEDRYINAVMPAKLQMDLTYVDERSIGLDLKLLLKTAYRLLYPYTQEKQPALRGRHLFLIDTLLIMLAYILSFVLRFDNITFWVEFLKYAQLLFAFLLIKLIVFMRLGLYRPVWRYAGVREFVTLGGTVTISTLIISIITLILWVLPVAWSPVTGFPRSVLGIDWLVTLMLIGGFRFTIRAINEFSPPATPALPNITLSENQQRTFIIGSTQSVARILREMKQDGRGPHSDMKLIGIISQKASEVRQIIHNLPVLGHIDDLAWLVPKHQITELIVAAPEVGGDLIRQILAQTQGLSLSIKTLPSYHDLLEHQHGLLGARQIQVEDLLRRKPIKTDIQQVSSYIQGNCILITGAGGSIGGELCRQISQFKPSEVVLVGHGENSIFTIQQELTQRFPDISYTAVIADIRDFGRTRHLLQRYTPDVIFHAAAHKHVGLVEQNPAEGVLNNVLGTKVLLEAAEAEAIPRLVLISSDKAVQSTCVMGATKRVAELMVQTVAKRSGFHYVVVRFGNVLGSRGSIVPIFQKQIERGGPVTITHPDVTRFFMTIPEAVQLVLQAAIIGQAGQILVLDMGAPIRILDLAENLIRLSGLKPNTDIPITFTGLKDGEKLHEALVNQAESQLVTETENFLIIPPLDDQPSAFWAQVDVLIETAYHNQLAEIRPQLQALLPEAHLIDQPTPVLA